MWLKLGFVIIICVASGLTISTAIYAFIAKLGVIPRLLARTNTAKYTRLFENGIVIGGILGNLYTFFHIHLPITVVGMLIIGLFWGIYVGCLAMAIAETLDVIPYFINKSKLKMGISGIIIAIALGKGSGTLLQLFMRMTGN